MAFMALMFFALGLADVFHPLLPGHPGRSDVLWEGRGGDLGNLGHRTLSGHRTLDAGHWTQRARDARTDNAEPDRHKTAKKAQ